MVFKNLSLIAAVADNGAIGLNGQLLYHFKEDMLRFKSKTYYNTLIMGKNTWYSLPKRPLEGRMNMILSSTMEDINQDNTKVYRSIDDILSVVQLNPDREYVVIGGSKVYEEFLPHCYNMYLTHIEDSPYADTFMPEINYDEWIVKSKTYIPQRPDAVKFSFVDYIRK